MHHPTACTSSPTGSDRQAAKHGERKTSATRRVDRPEVQPPRTAVRKPSPPRIPDRGRVRPNKVPPALAGRAPYPAIVGTLVHRLVGAVAHESRTADGIALPELCWARAGELVREAGLGSRARGARLEIAGAAARYLRWFLPPSSWTLAGVELEIAEGRLDLAWASPADMVLYDEVKHGVGRGTPDDAGPARRQAARYAAHGAAAHGGAFAGVRLVLLRSPRRSLLVLPGNVARPLVESPYWFDSSLANEEVIR